NAPRAVIDGLGSVGSLPLIANLGFVAAPELTGEAAEEDAAVKALAVGKHVELEDKIVPLPFGLDVAVAVLDVQLAIRGDREFGLVARNDFPTGQVFAIED